MVRHMDHTHTHTQTNLVTLPDSDEAEDWCFVCKDGGDLILCDNQNCSKVYHPDCVGNDGERTSQVGETWSCDRHSCSICKGTSEIHCLCCPISFCTSCIKVVKFARLRDKNGLCSECWTIVLLAENFPSSGTKKKKLVDFGDRDTYECLLKEYWEIVKEKEGFTMGDLVVAKAVLDDDKRQKKKGSMPMWVVDKTREALPSSSADDDLPSASAGEDVPSASTGEDLPSASTGEDLPSASAEENSDERTKIGKKIKKSKALKFSAQESKLLIQFLTSIGIDSTVQLSRSDVSSIIFKYIQERDLIHPTKQKKFICDKKLHVIFRKNTVSLKRIDDLLESHFPDNQRKKNGNKRCLELDQSGDTAVANKQQKISKERGNFASVVADNIKLVYLRRSLMEDLLKQPESFEEKVVGSFVKTNGEFSEGKISPQLLPVIGVKKSSSTDELNGRNVLLHVLTLPDIQISMLSDSDITEEDCKNLREKIGKGLLQRPTVEEIEKKAGILHQHIKKKWIERELVNLQNRIDRANEKGRRNELYQLIEQREKLKKEPEQERLLKQLPTVIADADADADADPLLSN